MLEAIGGAIALAVLGWLSTVGRTRSDRRRILKWLRANTRDEPGESHVSAAVIAKGTTVDEGRVRTACLKEPMIHRATGRDGVEIWSVWRPEPQSVYEKRGILIVGGGHR
jgi:hypothetical protein